MNEIIAQAATWARDLVSIAALVTLFVKPLRERLFGEKAVREGQKCLLRSELLRTYYRHQEAQSFRQYEYENMCYCYSAYKALGGNSFVDHIVEEMQTWEVNS